MDVLGSLGYHASYIDLESEIVAAVQSYYSAVDADVVVLGGCDVQPPAYVPYVVTDANNHPVLDSHGNEETRGVYQTVYVGGGPDEGTADLTDLGMASPTYPYVGGIDFFNQIPDDTAVVFADRILSPSSTGEPFEDLTDSVIVEAVATVIAHEAGHNFGLFHLDPDMTQFIMSGGFTTGEFNNPRTFATDDEPVDADYSSKLDDVTQSDANRLAFTVGSSVFSGRSAGSGDPEPRVAEAEGADRAVTRWRPGDGEGPGGRGRGRGRHGPPAGLPGPGLGRSGDAAVERRPDGQPAGRPDHLGLDDRWIA